VSHSNATPPGPFTGRTRALLALAAAVLVVAGWIIAQWMTWSSGPALPELTVGVVHDLVSLIPEAEASEASPHATQRFGLIFETDNRDALAALRVPTGTSLIFRDLPTNGEATLNFACGVAWPEWALGQDSVRFQIEARRETTEGAPAESSAEDADLGHSSGDWELVFNEVLAPAELPLGRQAVQRRVVLADKGSANWSLRFSTRRATGRGEALQWPGFLSPQLVSQGRTRTREEHQVEVAIVTDDLVATFHDASILQESPELPVALSVLDAAKGYSAAGGQRMCIRTAAPSRVAYQLKPQSGAALEFSIGMDTATGWKQPGDGMRFAVEINGERVWERTLRAPHVEKDRGWKTERIDLARWEGDSIQLDLITEPLESSDHDVGGWANVLLQRHDRVPRLTSSEAPTVLLILVDTLRADRLGVYGNTSGLSPNLDAMARRGLFFEQAQAASSWTWPSTASVLTGVPPNVHGVQDSEHSYLVDAHLTLPELFERAGYTTAGFSSNLLIGRADNFQQGFETFVHTPYASARAMNDRVTAWLDNTEGLARFGYIHYFDPHTPYLPPPGWMLPTPENVRPESELAPLASQELAAGGQPDQALVEEYRTLLMTQYDSEVRYFDHAFGELLEVLEERGALENCIIAFTSDHGEEFYEHEFFSHGGHLYEETLGVPLWITGYGTATTGPEAPISQGTVSFPVSNQDLLTTLCTLANLPLPESSLPATLRGQPLTALAREASASNDGVPDSGNERPVFGQTWHGHEAGVPGFTEKLSITSGPYKLIHTPASKRSELFDRSAGRSESINLATDPEAQKTLEQLQRTLRAWSHLTETAAQGIQVEENDKSLELLRQMGYVGGDDRDQSND